MFRGQNKSTIGKICSWETLDGVIIFTIMYTSANFCSWINRL